MRKVFSSGHYHFFAEDIIGWYDNTNKKGKRQLMLRANGGGLWELDKDQWEEFDKWIGQKDPERRTLMPKTPHPVRLK